MPRLVDDAVAVVARVGETEAEAFGVLLQPGESGRVFEGLVESGTAGRADVDGAAAVVFAVAGHRIHRKHLVDGVAACELAFDQSMLMSDRAEGGYGFEHDAFDPRGCLHRTPGDGGGLGHEHRASIGCEADEIEPTRFVDAFEAAVLRNGVPFRRAP